MKYKLEIFGEKADIIHLVDKSSYDNNFYQTEEDQCFSDYLSVSKGLVIREIFHEETNFIVNQFGYFNNKNQFIILFELNGIEVIKMEE